MKKTTFPKPTSELQDDSFWLSSRILVKMYTEILVRYLHFLSIIAVASALVGQLIFVRAAIPRGEVVRLQILDIIYGIGAVVVVATGFLQWFVVGKPASFYSPNPLIHIKTTLFLIVGLLSIYPSVFLGKHRKGSPLDSVEVPPAVIWSIRAEVILLFFLPLLATLIARGIGLSS